MNDTILNIAPDSISDSGTYTLHPYFKIDHVPERLMTSIAAVGIICPPIVLELDSGTYDIICGRRRLKAISARSEISVTACRVLDRKTPVETILCLLLEDQYQSSGLTITEQASFVGLCEQLIPNAEARALFIDNLPQGRITMGSQYLGRFSSMPRELQCMVHDACLSEKTALALVRLDEAEQLYLAELMREIQIGGNKQKKLLDDAMAISRRQHISIRSLFEKPEIQAILKDSTGNAPQKSARLFEVLFEMSSPLLSKALADFNAKIASLQLPKQCSVIPAAAFEKDEITLNVRFDNLDAFLECWQKIKKDI